MPALFALVFKISAIMIFPLKSYLLLSDFFNFFSLIAAILAYGSNHFFSEDDVLIWRSDKGFIDSYIISISSGVIFS